MTLSQLLSVIRGKRTNYRLFGISWTYYPNGDPMGKRPTKNTEGENDALDIAARAGRRRVGKTLPH